MPAVITVDWTTIILAVIGLIGTICSGVIAVFLAKVSKDTERIHTIVNSNQTQMTEQIKLLNNRLLALSLTNATLIETARSLKEARDLQEARNSMPDKPLDQINVSAEIVNVETEDKGDADKMGLSNP